MANIRVIYTNKAETSTISADSTNGQLIASNMLSDYKSEIHRSNGTSVIYTLTWAGDQKIGGVSLPCTNLSATATIRVKLYSDTAATQEIADSTVILACPNTPITEWTAVDVTKFQLGAVSKTSVWFNTQYTNVKAVKVTLVDSGNSVGYIDCAKIVCGEYWEPEYNVSKDGLSYSVTDTSTVDRNNAGDLLSVIGYTHDSLNFNLGLLSDQDRDKLVKIMRLVGVNKNILISVFPNSGNTSTEEMYTIYGKRSNSSIEYIIPGFNSHQVSILGW